ncbi:hypothetical protein [Marinivivus vitaminiproducens]|uniref:hypothetical protein n=1 Tax=Marinivivus vitaminiproducens TaxID=3035935 RepID=UPI0027A07DB1|nr:hypothetical protein P4R82_23890 [Geminicoccaceae bacterium SCSIO 64248]
MRLSNALEARIEFAAAKQGRTVDAFLAYVLERYGAGVDETGLPSLEAIEQAKTLIEDAGGSVLLPDDYDPEEDGLGGRFQLIEGER